MQDFNTVNALILQHTQTSLQLHKQSILVHKVPAIATHLIQKNVKKLNKSFTQQK